METYQTVTITILSLVGVVAFCSLFYRVADLQFNFWRDHLWMEISIIALAAIFIFIISH